MWSAVSSGRARSQTPTDPGGALGIAMRVPFGFIAATAYLRTQGYPLPIPEWSDRNRLERVLQGPPPSRAAYFERRLLEMVDSDGVDPA